MTDLLLIIGGCLSLLAIGFCEGRSHERRSQETRRLCFAESLLAKKARTEGRVRL